MGLGNIPQGTGGDLEVFQALISQLQEVYEGGEHPTYVYRFGLGQRQKHQFLDRDSLEHVWNIVARLRACICVCVWRCMCGW